MYPNDTRNLAKGKSYALISKIQFYLCDSHKLIVLSFPQVSSNWLHTSVIDFNKHFIPLSYLLRNKRFLAENSSIISIYALSGLHA